MKAIALVLALIATPAAAQEVSITIDNVITDRDPGGIIQAIVKVQNLTSAPITAVYIECAFQNGMDQAVDTGVDLVTDLEPGAIKYAKVSARFVGSMIQQRCYVDAVR